MPNRRFVLHFLVLILIMSGCAYNPIYLAERPFLAQQLPQGISMTDFVEPGPFGTRITVAEKLAWLGARPGLDGKIRDFTGQEIAFWQDRPSGADPGPEVTRAKYEALENLQKRYRVIIMEHDFQRLGFVY